MENVGTIGIVGAGAKGRAIARLALLGGYRVVWEDMSESRLTTGGAEITGALDAEVARGAMDDRRRRQIAANLATTSSMDELSRRGDVLIDAAPDDAELQLEIFTIFDKFAKPNAILASTADSVSVADLADMTNCPERCIGLRFSGRSAEKGSLTILRAAKTSEHTVQICMDMGIKMGLMPGVLSESAAIADAERESPSR